MSRLMRTPECQRLTNEETRMTYRTGTEKGGFA